MSRRAYTERYVSIDLQHRSHRYSLSYLDDNHFESMTTRKKIRNWVHAGYRAYILPLFEVFLALAWCALYVADSYYESTPRWITVLNWIFVAVFTFFFGLHLYLSDNRLRYLISPYAIVDYVTIIPYFFQFFAGSTFLRAVSILRVFRLLKLRDIAHNDTAKKLIQVSLTIVCFTFISTALLRLVEPDTFDTMFIAFYFIVVAIFTVGFGDISPHTWYGRLIVIAIILTGVILLPLQAYIIARIVLDRTKPFSGRYNPPSESKHIIIIGHFLPVHSLTDIIDEFVVKFRIIRQVDLHVILLQAKMPTPELEAFLVPPKDSAPFIHLLQGSPLIADDLNRASIKKAEGVITLFDNDHDTCLVHMALKAANRHIPIFSILQRPEKTLIYRSIAPTKEYHREVEPITLARWELSGALLARSVATRGFSTMIGNLLRTRFPSIQDDNSDHKDYRNGVMNEIYFGMLSPSHIGMNFTHLTIQIFLEYSCLLIGFMTESKVPILNPGSNYIINGNELGIFIAQSPSVIQQIKNMNHLPLEVESSPQRKTSSASTSVSSSSSSGNYKIALLTPPRAKKTKSADQQSKTNTTTSSNNKPNDTELRSTSSESHIQYEFTTNKLVRLLDAARNASLFREHYRISDSARTYRSALLEVAPEKDHIILYGQASIDWIYHIAPLRSKSVSKIQPLIIVTPVPLTAKQWSSVSFFPEIYMIPGASLLKRRDIERLNVGGATNLVLVGGGKLYSDPILDTKCNSQNTSTHLSITPELAMAMSEDITEGYYLNHSVFDPSLMAGGVGPHDRDSILIYAFMTHTYPKTRVVFDISAESDLRFLHKKSNSLEPFMQQEIRNGSAVPTTAIIERLLAQTIYNHATLDVVLQLIFGTRKIKEDSESDDEHGEPETIYRPLIRLEQIPGQLKGKSYLELFEKFATDRNVIPMGLYRSSNRLGKTRKDQFVWTCPPPDTMLEGGDRVYVMYPDPPTIL